MCSSANFLPSIFNLTLIWFFLGSRWLSTFSFRSVSFHGLSRYKLSRTYFLSIIYGGQPTVIIKFLPPSLFPLTAFLRLTMCMYYHNCSCTTPSLYTYFRIYTAFVLLIPMFSLIEQADANFLESKPFFILIFTNDRPLGHKIEEQVFKDS